MRYIFLRIRASRVCFRVRFLVKRDLGIDYLGGGLIFLVKRSLFRGFFSFFRVRGLLRSFRLNRLRVSDDIDL